MRTRTSMLFPALALAGLLGAAGCDETPCDPCPVDPQSGVSVCQVWEGDYIGPVSGQTGSCGSGIDIGPVLAGQLRVSASNIGPNPDGSDTTFLRLTLEDQEGNTTAFDGTICDTTDEQSPRSYSFSVGYTQPGGADGVQINNSLNGFFQEATETTAAHLEASYNATVSDLNNPQNNCSLQARIYAAR